MAATVTVVVLFTDAAPTGTWWIDAVYRAGFAIATVLAGSRARRWNLLIAAALVAIGSDGWMLVPAATALLLGIVMAWMDLRDRIVGAAAGGLVAWAALNLAWPTSPTAATAVLAALAVVPLWISAYRNARRPTRRWIERSGLVAVALIVIATALAGGFALSQRSPLLEAADSTVEAAGSLASPDGGNTEAFVENQATFASVADNARAWWMSPTRVVPLVAQHVRAVEVAARSGARLNGVAAELAATVDYDRLQLDNGAIDLALVDSFRQPVRNAKSAVDSTTAELASIDSPWLIEPLTGQLGEFRSNLVDAGTATAIADLAVQHLPGLLGGDRPRRYLLLLGNPAEARDIGGHLGNWAELIASNGKLDLIRVGVPYDLFAPWTDPEPELPQGIDLPPSLVEMEPTRFPQNWGASLDLATVGRLASALYPQASGGASIDGVLYADPVAFASLLQLTGPVEAAGIQLGPENAVRYLTRDQFLTPNPQDAPVSELIEIALNRLLDQQLPGAAALADAFGESVERGHLQFVSSTPSENELMELVGLDQPLPPPGDGDVVAVLSRNANPSKIDSDLHRTIDYDVKWDPETGRVRSRVVVTLRNAATAEGLPPLVNGSAVALPPGTNRTQLSLLSPFEARGAMVDGQGVGYSSRTDLTGLRRYSVVVDLPPGSERTVVLDLLGEVEPGPTYSLRWFNQPLVNDDTPRLLIETSGKPFGDGTDRGSVELGEQRVVELSVQAEGS